MIIVSLIDAERYPPGDQISDENENEIEPQSDQGDSGSAIDNDAGNHVKIAIPGNDEDFDLNSEWSNSESRE